MGSTASAIPCRGHWAQTPEHWAQTPAQRAAEPASRPPPSHLVSRWTYRRHGSSTQTTPRQEARHAEGDTPPQTQGQTGDAGTDVHPRGRTQGLGRGRRLDASTRPQLVAERTDTLRGSQLPGPMQGRDTGVRAGVRMLRGFTTRVEVLDSRLGGEGARFSPGPGHGTRPDG
jgi:hypothetical protein